MKKLLILILLLPFLAQAQVNTVLQKTAATGTVRSYSVGPAGTDTLAAVRLTGVIAGDLFAWSSTLKKLIPLTIVPIANGGTGSSTFTIGSIPFSNGTVLTQNNANFFWDNTNKRFGIGNNNPAFKLDIVDSIANNMIVLTNKHAEGYNAIRFNRQTGRGFTDEAAAVGWGNSSGIFPNEFFIESSNFNVGQAAPPIAIHSTTYNGSAASHKVFQRWNPANRQVDIYRGTGVSIWNLDSLGNQTITGTLTLKGSRVIDLASNFTTSGSFPLTLTTTASTNVTLPTSGTLLTTTGSAASLTNFPTFNQNTTGSAATLTTTRTIWGQNFNGSAIVSGALSGATTIAASSTVTFGTGTAAAGLLRLNQPSNDISGGLLLQSSGGENGGLFHNGTDLVVREAGVSLITFGSTAVTSSVPLSGTSLTMSGAGAFTGNVTAANLASGTYTPTLANITNTSGLTGRISHYIRVGNEVTVTGRAEVNSTTTGAGSFSVSLPIASNLASTSDLSGSGSGNAGFTVQPHIEGIVASDLAQIYFTKGSTGISEVYFTFMYTVL